ncbi:MAG: hypothetical protein KAJ03_06670 [Gammaproteobacteria bacterium]|nr:hypothetical protein [Gammaproteobacteria bacterium]
MTNNNFCKIVFVLLCVIAIEGCVTYSYDETFVIDAESDVSYQFALAEDEHLNVAIETQNGSVDVLIFDSSNFFKYDDETSTAKISEPDAFYENVNAKEIRFVASRDGEWYLVIENNNGFDVSINVMHDAH